MSQDLDRVRRIPEWAALRGLSLSTARRLLAEGKGPKVTRLSPRIPGIRDSDDRAWLERCAEEKLKAR
jgi:predicted DNA-binding transcriptional regulator AlpA